MLRKACTAFPSKPQQLPSKPKAPLCKGSWRAAPEGLLRKTADFHRTSRLLQIPKLRTGCSRDACTDFQCHATIPQSASRPAPFTQGSHGRGSEPQARVTKLAHVAAKRLRDCCGKLIYAPHFSAAQYCVPSAGFLFLVSSRKRNRKKRFKRGHFTAAPATEARPLLKISPCAPTRMPCSVSIQRTKGSLV